MEYYAFLIFGGMILAVVFIGVGVIIGGISEGASDRCDSDSIHSGGVCDGCDSDLGERDEKKLDRFSYRLDNETAVIALKVIKHDLHNMLSDTENRAIDYAIDEIRKGESADSLE